MGTVSVALLEPSDIELLRHIDRGEQLEVEYTVSGGQLVTTATDFFVPAWDPAGSGDHSVNSFISFWGPDAQAGAQLIGAFDDDEVVGMAMVEVSLRPGLGWLALLYVTNGRRRNGVGQALWDEAASIAGAGGATAMYVSSAPTGSAVQFYLKQGCGLAARHEIVPELYELEPDDIHLMCPL